MVDIFTVVLFQLLCWINFPLQQKNFDKNQVILATYFRDSE